MTAERLTEPQRRLVTFLAEAGRATPGTIARFMWADDRERGRAQLMCERLVAAGVLERHLNQAPPRELRSYKLTRLGERL